jgi:hypothetical protein
MISDFPAWKPGSKSPFIFVFLELQEDLSQLETTSSSPEKFRLCIPQSTSKEEKETKVLTDFVSVLDRCLFIASRCVISYKSVFL